MCLSVEINKLLNTTYSIMKKTNKVKTAKTSTTSKTSNRTVKVKAQPAPITVIPVEVQAQPAPTPITVLHFPPKPIQSFVGRVSVSKQPTRPPRQPSRLTDIIACPTYDEFKRQVLAIPTGNRFEFKGTSSNSARAYVFYPLGMREGAPSRPRIITWVQSPAIPAGAPNTGKFRVEALDGNTFSPVDKMIFTDTRQAGDHLQHCREAWIAEHNSSSNPNAAAMANFKVAVAI